MTADRDDSVTRVKPVTPADFDALVGPLCNADPALSAARQALNAQHWLDMGDPEYVRNYENWLYVKLRRGNGQGLNRSRHEFEQDLRPSKK